LLLLPATEHPLVSVFVSANTECTKREGRNTSSDSTICSTSDSFSQGHGLTSMLGVSGGRQRAQIEAHPGGYGPPPIEQRRRPLGTNQDPHLGRQGSNSWRPLG
jgi:hypothetical protein